EAILGKALAAKGKPDEASKHFDTALAMSRDDFEAYRYIAVTMAKAVGVEIALEQTKKRLEADREAGRSTAEALKLTMQLLFQAKKYDEALRTGDEIIKAADRDDDLMFGQMAQAIVLTEIGRYDEAVKKYDSALKLDPGDPFALNNMAYVLVDKLKRPKD